MNPFCIDCGRREEWCRCPMKTQDLALSVAIFCLALAFALAMWLRSARVTVPLEEPQEQGSRLLKSSIPPPRWLQLRPPPRHPTRLA